MKSQFSHIIWDWNGTLLNDAGASWEVMNNLLLRRGKPAVSFERYKQAYRHPIIELYRDLEFDLTREEISALGKEWGEGYAALLETTVSLHHDSLAALLYFQQQGAVQAVLSAHYQEALVQDISRFGVRDFFVKISGLHNRHAVSKAENGKSLMAELQANPETTVLIGDSSHDVEVATELGISCILVNRGYEDMDRLSRHAVPIFHSFQEMLKLQETTRHLDEKTFEQV